jgi:hypothetical protein
LACDFLDGESDRRDRYVEDSRNVVSVVPATRNGCSNVRLALMIGNDHFNGSAQHTAASVLDRQTSRDDGAGPCEVCVNAALIIEHADFDGVG